MYIFIGKSSEKNNRKKASFDMLLMIADMLSTSPVSCYSRCSPTTSSWESGTQKRRWGPKLASPNPSSSRFLTQSQVRRTQRYMYRIILKVCITCKCTKYTKTDRCSRSWYVTDNCYYNNKCSAKCCSSLNLNFCVVFIELGNIIISNLEKRLLTLLMNK